MLRVGWGTNSHLKHLILSFSGSQETYPHGIFMKCLNPPNENGSSAEPLIPALPSMSWMNAQPTVVKVRMCLSWGAASGFRWWGPASALQTPTSFQMAYPQPWMGVGEGSQELDPSSVSSQPTFYFNIHLRRFEWALRKNCLSLSSVILMDTDVFMIINKISETEFYEHIETLKSPSLSWEIV